MDEHFSFFWRWKYYPRPLELNITIKHRMYHRHDDNVEIIAMIKDVRRSSRKYESRSNMELYRSVNMLDKLQQMPLHNTGSNSCTV